MTSCLCRNRWWFHHPGLLPWVPWPKMVLLCVPVPPQTWPVLPLAEPPGEDPFTSLPYNLQTHLHLLPASLLPSSFHPKCTLSYSLPNSPWSFPQRLHTPVGLPSPPPCLLLLQAPPVSFHCQSTHIILAKGYHWPPGGHTGRRKCIAVSLPEPHFGCSPRPPADSCLCFLPHLWPLLIYLSYKTPLAS